MSNGARMVLVLNAMEGRGGMFVASYSFIPGKQSMENTDAHTHTKTHAHICRISVSVE